MKFSNKNNAYPSRKSMYYPLVSEISKRGGKSKPKELYDVLADYFELSDELRLKKVDGNSSSDLRWHNIVRWVRQDLADKGVIIKNKDHGIWELSENALSYFSSIDEERIIAGETTESVYSQGQLDSLLQLQKTIGDIGEEKVIEYEKQNLEKVGLFQLAKNVKSVSKDNCCLGYDIISYYEDGNEKYIEVKSSTSDQLEFYISINEMNKAKKYGEKYCIYLVRGIDIILDKCKEIIPICNFYKLLDEEKVNLIAIKWKVSLSD